MDQIPNSVRVRTDEGNEWRFDAISKASEYYGCNQSDAVAYACEDVVHLVGTVRQVLERDDLTPAQKREIAAAFDDCDAVEFAVDETVRVERDP